MPQVTVGYVPTLGVVHPDAITPRLFEMVCAIAGTGRFLPYDPHRYWLARKPASVLADQVHHTPDRTVIPVLDQHTDRTLTAYHYAPAPPDIRAARRRVRRLAARVRARHAGVVFFTPHDRPRDGVVATRVMLRELTDPVPPPASTIEVRRLHGCPPAIQDTFAAFARDADPAMAFLGRRWRRGTVDGPILVAVHGGLVVGACGPLRTAPDPAGRLRLHSGYFAVHPDRRGHGYGRALWRTALAWGRQHGAGYQILRAEAGGPAEHLYHTEGFRHLGLVCKLDT